MASKQDLSERDICTHLILPALKKAGWVIATQAREEVSFAMVMTFMRITKLFQVEKSRDASSFERDI